MFPLALSKSLARSCLPFHWQMATGLIPQRLRHLIESDWMDHFMVGISIRNHCRIAKAIAWCRLSALSTSRNYGLKQEIMFCSFSPRFSDSAFSWEWTPSAMRLGNKDRTQLRQQRLRRRLGLADCLSSMRAAWAKIHWVTELVSTALSAVLGFMAEVATRIRRRRINAVALNL
jgi:hypothetical protein